MQRLIGITRTSFLWGGLFRYFKKSRPSLCVKMNGEKNDDPCLILAQS